MNFTVQNNRQHLDDIIGNKFVLLIQKDILQFLKNKVKITYERAGGLNFYILALSQQ